MSARCWTIGHSTRSIEDFIAALDANAIKLLGDVRSLPGSNRYPQFDKEEFRKGVGRLVDLAGKVGPAAIMCAETVWWRCHRALISDFLKARGVEVIHIVDATRTESHPFTSAARIVDGSLTYAMG
jgi:uncharacterized protein (DUF488 family)